ncbi:hypothetical protein [Microscilla marina]|uniref:Uncharacterized protein n=1 Tax=Microscilla marina ATCC 23134 TaxID=313606 RepID=A1ZQS9_MICM2|nr:hypothetical protein [Microscilla marina]EAY27234.1 hypothetical protein M23134_06544 [Microscilla marina ATCC 23134]
MKKSDYQTFQTFFSQDEAQAFIDFFEENNIRHIFERNYTIEPNAEQAASILIKPGESLQNEWVLKIHAADVVKADYLLQQEVEKVTEVPKEHYLHQFDNQELKDIVQKPNEWNRQDVHFAQLLLKQRNRS